MPIIFCILLIGGMLALELVMDQDDEHTLRLAKMGMLALFPVMVGILICVAILK